MKQLAHETITTTAGRKIRFENQQNVVVARAAVDSMNARLWFELEVLRTVEGQFVSVIKAHLDEVAAPKFIEAEIVDSQTDVENFFFVFDPMEVAAKLLDWPPMRKVDRRANRLHSFYDSLVFNLLWRFSSDDASRQDRLSACWDLANTGQQKRFSFPHR